MIEVGAFDDPSEKSEEKPKRKYRRRKKKEDVVDQTQSASELARTIGQASANLANQIVTHLPRRWFEQKQLSEQEATGIAESTSMLASGLDDEETKKLAKSFPLIVLGGIGLIVILSRLKRRESGEATRTDTDIRQGGFGQDDSREETRSSNGEEKRETTFDLRPEP